MLIRETEYTILRDAIQAINDQTGLDLRADFNKVEQSDNTQQLVKEFDGYIAIAGRDQIIPVEIRQRVKEVNLNAVINQLPLGGVLATDFLDRKLANALKDKRIQFVDTAGNAFIDYPGIFIQIIGNPRKPKEHLVAGPHHRAFEHAGLKVIFALVREPKLVQEPYRKIAEKAGVANGAITWVMKGLKETGFLFETNDGKRRLRDIPQLADRWAQAYPLKLQPKLQHKIFQVEYLEWWKEVQIEEFGGVWGGEIAADYLTGYLRPQEVTVFIPDVFRTQFIAKHRLRTATDGVVDRGNIVLNLYQLFWTNSANTPNNQNYADPLLVYAELLATNDPRNHETARMIYEKYFVQAYREN